MRRSVTTLLCATMLAGGAAWSAASAETVKFRSELKAANEVPPNSSEATGTAEMSFDSATRKLTWSVTYSGLSGPAIGAHLHGPGMHGANAGIALPFPFVNSPINGSATLTDAQANDLMAGKWYVNIHTTRNPGGEIRGQVLQAKE
jgi:hypothetical protein